MGSGDPGDEASVLAVLARHLRSRREAILEEWHERVQRDPRATAGLTLSIAHFQDLIPEILDRLEERLAAGSEGVAEGSILEHGAHRWKQGYSLRELVAEWGHLECCVLGELDDYGMTHPEMPPAALSRARRALLEMCGAGVADSVERYSELQKAEAAGVLDDLQSAVDGIRRAERERAASWHEAAHDLRGNVGLLTTSTALLAQEDLPAPLRAKAVDVLQGSVSSLLQLLEDLMGLARLEAGRERLRLETFDAAAHLRSLCSALEPLAHERGLSFHAEGPASLEVECDPTKLQRILQNLVLNALKYTETGGVAVTWAETDEIGVERWLLRVEDTGPGFGSPIAGELESATDTARRVERDNPRGGAEPVADPPTAAPPPCPRQRPGEGIGLSIVKRLCELLDASLELASSPAGTVVQVVLPCSYPKSDG